MKHFYKRLLSIKLAAVIVGLNAVLVDQQPAYAKSSKKKVFQFNQLEVETDFKITHPIEVASLDGIKQQVIVIGESEKKKPILTTYELSSEENSSQQLIQKTQIEIPKHFLAYDILKNGIREKLLFQTNKDIQYYNFESNQFQQMQTISSIYLRPEAQFLVKKELVKDINGDKKDDLVIPDFQGVHVYLQNPEGDFEHQTLPVPPRIQMNKDSTTFNESRFFIADLNLDKKNDFVLAKDKSLHFYVQNEDGTFEKEPTKLPLNIDTSELFWWELRESDGQQVDQNNLAHRIVDQIEDINNDGIADLLVRFSQSEGVLDRTNDYEIYLGKNQDGQLTYASKPEGLIKADGTIGDLDIVDVDGDKKSEVLVSSFDIGVSQIIGALLSGSIDQDVYLFKMDENGTYPEDPVVDKEVEMTFSLSSGRSGEPVIKLADFNGDGLKDLMFSSGDSRLKIYPGTKAKRVFGKRAERFKITVPKEGKHVETVDINKDGKEDVIVKYGRQDDESLSNKFVLFVAH